MTILDMIIEPKTIGEKILKDLENLAQNDDNY